MPNSPITIRLRHNPGFMAWSHGWAYLAPFSEDGDYLRLALRLPKAGPRQVAIRWSEQTDTIRVGIPGRKIGEADRDFIRSRVRWMFRADEDFTEFWALCRGHGVLRHCKSNRTGALLRCPTVFEDVVKTICTINAHWRNTKRMVDNLCQMFGEACPGDGEAFTFPGPDRLAGASVQDLQAAKLGFRARYVGEFARRVVDGDLGSRRLVPGSRTPMPCVQRSSASKGSATTPRTTFSCCSAITIKSPAIPRCGRTWASRPRYRRRKSSGSWRSDTGTGGGSPIWPTSLSGCLRKRIMWIASRTPPSRHCPPRKANPPKAKGLGRVCHADMTLTSL